MFFLYKIFNPSIEVLGDKYLSKYTGVLITLNHEDYKTASKKFKHTKVEYVPGVGVDTVSIHTSQIDVTAKKSELGLPQDKKIILNVSELIPRKNIQASLNAFAKANNDNAVANGVAELNLLFFDIKCGYLLV